MGEKIRDAGELEVKGKRFTVELVELNGGGGREPDIYIQSEDLRLEIPRSVFFEAGANLLLARKQLKIIKGIIMSNPALVVLTKMVNESCCFTVEIGLGEVIHIHYADSLVNIRIDLSVDDFFHFCDEVERTLDGLLDGVVKCSDFDENFLISLAPIIMELSGVSYGTVMLEDLLSSKISPKSFPL